MSQKAAFNYALATEGLFTPLQSRLWDCSYKQGMADVTAPAAPKRVTQGDPSCSNLPEWW